MIILRASLTIDSANRDTFLTALKAFVNVSRNDDGCLSYEAYEDVSMCNLFLVLAMWRTFDALDSHEATPHVKKFKSTVSEMIVEREPSQVYTVSDQHNLNT